MVRINKCWGRGLLRIGRYNEGGWGTKKTVQRRASVDV